MNHIIFGKKSYKLLTLALFLFGLLNSGTDAFAATFSYQYLVNGGARAGCAASSCYTETFVYQASLDRSFYHPNDSVVVTGSYMSGTCTNGVTTLFNGLASVNNIDGAQTPIIGYGTASGVPSSVTYSAGSVGANSSISLYSYNNSAYGLPALGSLSYKVVPSSVCLGFDAPCTAPVPVLADKTALVTPTNTTTSGDIGAGSIRDAGCFVAGTQVLLADGYSTKLIEDVKPGEKIMTSGGPEQVMKKYAINYKGMVYAFNGDGNYFVTPTHPFMTNNGWKSLDPEGTKKESPGIKVSKLAIGDVLILQNGKQKTLTQLDSKEMVTTVYNFGLNGTHDFYADGYLVHNVNFGLIEHASALIAIEKP